MKRAHSLLVLALMVGGVAPAEAGSVQRPVVVELFTSQGCDTCPPADALLARLAERHGVLAMSLPVNYWDMLGWRDTLATDGNTHRQKAYAAAMAHGGVYTPQIIVDGVADVVGSRESDVESAIERRAAEIQLSQARKEAIAAAHEAALAAHEAALAQAAEDNQAARAQAMAVHEELLAARRATIEASRENRQTGVLAVPVSVAESPNSMHIVVGASDDKAGNAATVWLFHLRDAVTVSIGAGENEGRTITYRNVVADIRAVGRWTGDPASIDVPRAAFNNVAHDAVAVIVQQGGYGRVVGATLLSHPEYAPSR